MKKLSAMIQCVVFLLISYDVVYAHGLKLMTKEPADSHTTVTFDPETQSCQKVTSNQTVGYKTQKGRSGSLIWQTSKEDAVAMAKNQGKKILLLAGRETCGFTMYMRNTVSESTSPSVRCLIEQNFITWFCDVDSSTDWYPYADGLGSFSLPLICCIDPDSSDSYLDRTTGIQESEEFYSRLKNITGSDCVTVHLSGYVKDSDGSAISDVMISFGNNGGMAKTDRTGYYTHNVPYGWSGTAALYKIGYIFIPANRFYNNAVSDQTGQDYIGNTSDEPYILEIYYSGRVASLLMPSQEYDAWNGNTSTAYTKDDAKIANFLYTRFNDVFDFIFLISNNDEIPSGLGYYGISHSVKNDVEGIGISLFDLTSDYGSSGKLRSIIHFAERDGLRYGPGLHEILHTWGSYVVETSYSGHWGFSSAGGQLGGFGRDTLTDLGGGVYQANNGRKDSTSFGEFANGGNSLPYSDIELYLMGIIDKSNVAPLLVAVNPEWVDMDTGKFSAGGFSEYSIEDIIRKNGVRKPSAAESQKQFRAVTVILTPAPLTEQQWEEVDGHVQFMSFPGDDGSDSYNFWEATRGSATIKMEIGNICPGTTDCAGDADGNGIIELNDAILILKMSVGMNVTVNPRADVNGDGKIGMEEVIYILQKVAGIFKEKNYVSGKF